MLSAICWYSEVYNPALLASTFMTYTILLKPSVLPEGGLKNPVLIKSAARVPRGFYLAAKSTYWNN